MLVTLLTALIGLWQVAAWLQKHVKQVKSLVENGGVIRQCDPLFAAVFDVCFQPAFQCTCYTCLFSPGPGRSPTHTHTHTHTFSLVLLPPLMSSIVKILNWRSPTPPLASLLLRRVIPHAPSALFRYSHSCPWHRVPFAHSSIASVFSLVVAV